MNRRDRIALAIFFIATGMIVARVLTLIWPSLCTISFQC